MTLIESVILGVIQGLTEFLPVSSSGHLVVAQSLLGFQEPLVAFDIWVHCGTLLAVVIYFKKELVGLCKSLFSSAANAKEEKTEVFLLVIGTLPTVGIALLMKDAIETFFASPWVVAVAWLIMGGLLVMSKRIKEGVNEPHRLSWFRAVLIGVAQGIALIPGVSRSGSTILAGMSLGLQRAAAARFSFLLAIPAILGAAVLKLKDGIDLHTVPLGSMMLGFLTSATVGYICVRWLMQLIQQNKFYYFGYYCLAASLITLILHSNSSLFHS